jgi:GNAT superfamily N-acetyltransferase
MPFSLERAADALSKKRARVRTRGAGEVAKEFVGKIRGAARSDNELIFLSRDADGNTEPQRKTDEPLRLVRSDAKDALDYERFIGTDSARTFAKRLSHETDCWLMRGRGMILHATWTTTGAAWTGEIDRYFVPPERAAYVYESFTRPEARGLGIYPIALVEIGRALAADGIEQLFIGVETGNAPSLRAITKAGFEPAFTISFRRRFGRLTIDEATGPRAELARRCLRER